MVDAAAKEPSMEDILSSIRKIISEENKMEESGTNMRASSGYPETNTAPARPSTTYGSPDVDAITSQVAKAEVPSSVSSGQPAGAASGKPMSLSELADATRSHQAPPRPQPEVQRPQVAQVPEPVAARPQPAQTETVSQGSSLAQIAASVAKHEQSGGANMTQPANPASSNPAPATPEPANPVQANPTVANQAPAAAASPSQPAQNAQSDAVQSLQAIRQSLSGDQSGGGEAPKAEPPAAPVQAPVASAQPSAPPTEPKPEPAQPAAASSAASRSAEEAAFKGALVSPSTDSAVNESFERLKRSAMDDIEAKTEAILRPLLREWLDNNLPSMVERLVREEIERVSRGI